MKLDIILAMARLVEPLAPAADREWLHAMRAEADHANPDEELEWALGLFTTGCQLAITRGTILFSAALALGIAGLVWWDWHTVETERVLAVLFATSCLLSIWHPRRSVLSGVLLGSCLLFAHATSELTGLARPFYCWKALSCADWLTILAVLPPALVAARLGAYARLGAWPNY